MPLRNKNIQHTTCRCDPRCSVAIHLDGQDQNQLLLQHNFQLRSPNYEVCSSLGAHMDSLRDRMCVSIGAVLILCNFSQTSWDIAGEQNTGVALALLLDGNLVLVDSDNVILWQTDTHSNGMSMSFHYLHVARNLLERAYS